MEDSLQKRVDRYERWLARQTPGVPMNDPVFQKIAWLCGVVHDVIPELIDEAQAEGWEERATNLEGFYLIVRDLIGSIMGTVVM